MAALDVLSRLLTKTAKTRTSVFIIFNLVCYWRMNKPRLIVLAIALIDHSVLIVRTQNKYIVSAGQLGKCTLTLLYVSLCMYSRTAC